MLFFASALFALAKLAAAQSPPSSADIATVQANFNNAELVPDLLEKFNPQATVTIAYGGQSLSIGQKIEQSAVGSAPTLTVAASENSNVTSNGKYTVLLIDADIVGTNSRSTALTRHWLVNGASVSSADPQTVTFDGATTITDYAGPGPASGSGPHRYTILIYNQPDSFQAPANLSTAGTPLGTMFLNSYVSESGLGELVAANYFQVENGVATVSVPETTAVNTGALGGATTTSGAVAASTSSATSNTGSAAAGSSSSPASSPSPTSAASSTLDLSRSLAVGVIGFVGAVIGAGVAL